AKTAPTNPAEHPSSTHRTRSNHQATTPRGPSPPVYRTRAQEPPNTPSPEQSQIALLPKSLAHSRIRLRLSSPLHSLRIILSRGTSGDRTESEAYFNS